MKQSRLFVLVAICTFVLFGSIIYSSCKKDKCSGVSCQNGGVCSDGQCQCPSGYSGVSCELSSIKYVNDAYTPINISFNGSTASIPVGGSVIFIGTSGDAAVVNAYTSGTSSTGNQVGELVTWSTFTDYFPSNGAYLVEPLDVDPAYFFLNLVNNDASASVVSVTVNNGLPAQTTDYITIPNNGYTYGIGYYLGYSNTEVYCASSINGSYWTSFPSIPNVANATVTVTVN